LRVDAAVKLSGPDGWRGVQAREQVIKAAIFEVVGMAEEVERLFPIVKAQAEY
jgi:type I restriction enzyme R subunit